MKITLVIVTSFIVSILLFSAFSYTGIGPALFKWVMSVFGDGPPHEKEGKPHAFIFIFCFWILLIVISFAVLYSLFGRKKK
ncbi:hypothetical protein [Pseudobacter ginsenosidimutans]|uniref:hypothetical protein n=1 Tax=Pseudobacter ginsenosidimutans TaxID=661488 RepID=UPI00102D94DD|nr:hypothetical protein [Pseudobacter ginsenosidimutans]QEC41844.1 hypothetical protein FSB84_09130 [Pseudobacter ginsenosidimutans]